MHRQIALCWKVLRCLDIHPASFLLQFDVVKNGPSLWEIGDRHLVASRFMDQC